MTLSSDQTRARAPRAIPLAMILVAMLCLVALLLGAAPVAAQPGPTTFTYQGRLDDNGVPANGTFAFSFELWSKDSEGTQLGTANDFAAVTVTDGLFTVELDFGENYDPRGPRYLQISAGPDSGSLSTLSPRRAVTFTPQAMLADTASLALDAERLDGLDSSAFDQSTTNELVTSFSLDGTDLTLTDAGGSKTVSLEAFDNLNTVFTDLGAVTITRNSDPALTFPHEGFSFSLALASGGGPNPYTLNSMQLAKGHDATSPLLREIAMTGEVLPAISITHFDAAIDAFVEITLTDVGLNLINDGNPQNFTSASQELLTLRPQVISFTAETLEFAYGFSIDFVSDSLVSTTPPIGALATNYAFKYDPSAIAPAHPGGRLTSYSQSSGFPNASPPAVVGPSFTVAPGSPDIYEAIVRAMTREHFIAVSFSLLEQNEMGSPDEMLHELLGANVTSFTYRTSFDTGSPELFMTWEPTSKVYWTWEPGTGNEVTVGWDVINESVLRPGEE